MIAPPVLFSLFLRYGYALILATATVEGDTALVTGAFLAQRGYFDIRLVAVCACLGTIIGNQAYYWIGHGAGRSRRVPARALLERAGRLLAGRGVWIIVFSRFVYGLRIAIPVACGVTRLPPLRFSVIDTAGAVVWTMVIASFGAAIAHVFGRLVADIRRYEWPIAFVGMAIGIAYLLWRRPDRPARALLKE
jgi:membrane protein DedA with SNARE-associated domain